MATLLQCIDKLIESISVTDRQEDNIKNSLNNLNGYLKNKDNDLGVERTFTTGSWERDTIIRPLSDIDLFAVLEKEKWQNEFGGLKSPQSVLTKIKNYLNDIEDYRGKVTQDRPCVTVELSNKNFDILPSFATGYGGYMIPNFDLSGWVQADPETLTTNLDWIHKHRNYRVKQIVKVVRYWNKEHGKLIPSYHIDEVAFNIFSTFDFKNFEEGIRTWFDKAESYLWSEKFKSTSDFDVMRKKVVKVKDKLNLAKQDADNGKEGSAIKIWKDIFGKEFPTIDIDEAKKISEALSKGGLKITQAGTLSTTLGSSVGASQGFHHGNLREEETL